MSANPNTDLAAEVADLKATVARLEAALASGTAPPPPPPAAADTDPGDRRVGRRRALVGLAGAAVAGTASAIAPGAPAAAANGDPLVLGSVTNQATAPTGLAVTGLERAYGIGATDNGFSGSTGSAAIFGHARNQAFYYALRGRAEGSATGLLASSATGTAVYADGGDGIGVYASGGFAGIRVYSPTMPIWIDPVAPSPPLDTVANPGTIFTTAEAGGAALWFRVRGSTTSPDGWRKVAGPTTAGAFHLLPTPKRVYDSRPGTTPSQGPKTKLPAGNVARTIDLTHNASGVPADATGVVLTVLLVNAAAGGGNLTIWSNGQPKPQSNTVVWGGSAGRFTATAMTAVDAQARVKVDASLATDLVLDVVGYYR